MNATALIIQREYLERVRKKSFIISTILVPILMLALSVLPAVLMFWAGSDTKTIAVIDDSGIILPELQDTEDVRYIPADAPQDSLLASDDIYGVLIIDRNIVKHPNGVRLLTPNSASMSVEGDISRQMSKIIENEKLKQYDIENLDQILADVKTHVVLQTLRTTSTEEEGESQSAAISSALGTILNFVLYMFIILYGSLVMNSIIEEKTNRVLEIVVSSVKPTQLMLGKIVGVGLVAVTQIMIWVVLMTVIATAVLPALIPADMIAEAQAINAGTADLSATSMDLDLAAVLGIVTNVGYVAKLMGLLALFLVGGYFLYASIFASIGAAVDNIQDASQLQMLAVGPVIVGLIASMAVVPDPNSTFALIMSLIPLTSPMVMMTRVPFDVPGWEIALSLVLLYISIVFMIWLAAKIYRVGIFMYGKKPTIADLIRWARYK